MRLPNCYFCSSVALALTALLHHEYAPHTLPDRRPRGSRAPAVRDHTQRGQHLLPAVPVYSARPGRPLNPTRRPSTETSRHRPRAKKANPGDPFSMHTTDPTTCRAVHRAPARSGHDGNEYHGARCVVRLARGMRCSGSRASEEQYGCENERSVSWWMILRLQG